MVLVDLGAVRARLQAAGEEDRAAWEGIRAVLLDAVGDSTFEIWLAPLELISVDLDGALVVSAPRDTVGWVARRFGRILDSAAKLAGRRLWVADELERQAAESLGPIATATAADASARGSGDPPDDGASYPTPYTDVYTQLTEVS